MKAWTAHVMQLWNVIMSLCQNKKTRSVRISVLLHIVLGFEENSVFGIDRIDQPAIAELKSKANHHCFG